MELRLLAWTPPDDPVDCVLLTSASAARLAGPAAATYRALPVYAVGASTAEAARAAGFRDIRTGARGMADLLDLAMRDGRKAPLWLAGRERTELPPGSPAVTIREVYAADLLDLSGEARWGLGRGRFDWVLLFSTRTAAHFAEVCRHRPATRIAAISREALTAAGLGWRDAVAPAVPSEAALFAAADLTCDKGA